MSLQTLSEWLRCPNCFQPLSAHAPLTLVCVNGHSFDVNKRGFVSMVTGSRNLTFDSPVMLDARDSFLEAGWYGGLRESLATIAAGLSPGTVIDAGCGTGYYLRGIQEVLPDSAFLAVDLSPAAVARVVRRSGSRSDGTDVDGLVADVWSPLPIRDRCADLIVNVFAPRNAQEFHRILRPGGTLLVAIPQDSHLQELRARGLALDIQPDKHQHLLDALSEYFALDSTSQISTMLSLGTDDVSALIAMGPSSHHGDAGSGPTTTAAHGQLTRHQVTAAFEVLSFHPLDARPGTDIHRSS